jgi:aspartyl protease family protein
MTEDQTLGLFWGVGALALVLSSLTARRMAGGGQLLKYVLGWAGIFAVFYSIFLFRNDIGGLWDRVKADVSGTPAASSTGAGIAVPMDADGHFWVEARTTDGSARLLIDSGATTTVLDRATAERLGIVIDNGFPVIVGTANGNIRVQRGQAARLWVGEILVTDLEVLVSDADDLSVLGMNWLSRMDSWRVQGRTMQIEPRGSSGGGSISNSGG